MSSRGAPETEALKHNLESQVTRLLNQLADLEDELESGGMTADEVSEMKAETHQELDEIKETLKKFSSGNVSLVNDLNKIQLAIQASVSNAFKSPEIVRLFTAKKHQQIRQTLADAQEAYSKDKDDALFKLKAGECLSALVGLGIELEMQEKILLKKLMSSSHFESTADDSENLDFVEALQNAAKDSKLA